MNRRTLSTTRHLTAQHPSMSAVRHAPAHPLLVMQQQRGNQAVLRHLQGQSTPPLLQRWVDPTSLNTTTFPPATATDNDYKNYYTTHMRPDYVSAYKGSNRKDRQGELNTAFGLLNTELKVNPLNHAQVLQLMVALALKINEILRENDEQTAYQEPKFGTEFTFTNEHIMHSVNGKADASGVYADAKIRKWGEVMGSMPIVESQARKVVKGMPAIKFIFKNDWWCVVSRDDGCVELQTLAINPSEAYSDITTKAIQAIFEVAQSDALLLSHSEVGRGSKWKDENLRTDPLIGGGHLSMDRATTFGKHARAFRNFMVQYVNDHEVWETYDDDEINAPTIPELPRRFRQEFEDIIGEFDTCYTDPNQPDMTIDQLSTAIQTRVYQYVRQSNQIDHDPHYQAINLEHIDDPKAKKKRIEMRRFRAQTDFKDFMSQISLLAGLRDTARDFTDNGGLIPLRLDTTTKQESDRIPRGSIKVKD